MNYIANYLAIRNYKEVSLASDDALFDSDFEALQNATCIKNINKGITKSELQILHNYLGNKEEFYDCLQTINSDSVFLYYDENTIDYFKTWEILRQNVKNITIVLQKSERKREIILWEKDKSNAPELSVIFPVYNVGKYIRQCIESVVEWDAPYVEYIFVSDGSKDDSVDIIKEYMSKDSRIKLIEKENGGCASARQVGLEAATGKYVGFIDPDDFIDPTMFKKLLRRALLNNLDISVCGYNEYYNNSGLSKPVDDNIHFPLTEGLFEREDVDQFIAYLRIGIWRGIYRREMILENGIHFYTDLPRFDDLPFKVETMAVAKSVATVDEYLYYYRLDREGQTVGVNDKKLFVHFDIFKHLDKFFENRSDNQKHYYSIVKRDTHNWALSKLDKKYIKEYKALMKED